MSWYPIIRVLVIIVALYVIIRTVKIVRILLTVALGAIYIPINNLNMASQKWYFGIRHKDPILYLLYTPFYWILVAITFIISIPYEFVISEDIH